MKRYIPIFLLFLSFSVTANNYRIIFNKQKIELPTQPGISLNQTFTTCGQSGRFGPSLSQCQSAYNGTQILGNNLNYNVASGIQSFDVPKTGVYKITVIGAQGGDGLDGSGHHSQGGYGVKLTGYFNLTKGNGLKIVVGQKGVEHDYNYNSNLFGYGGGGGGSYVALSDNTPLIVAAGGGGANEVYNGINGSISYGDGNGLSTGIAKGGCGGGFFTNGNCSGGYGGDGKSFINGSVGGTTNYFSSADGGFGGGSGTQWNGSGAGGGYSGGSGEDAPSATSSGVPAKSYNSGTNKTSGIYSSGGDGKVIIQFISG